MTTGDFLKKWVTNVLFSGLSSCFNLIISCLLSSEHRPSLISLIVSRKRLSAKACNINLHSTTTSVIMMSNILHNIKQIRKGSKLENFSHNNKQLATEWHPPRLSFCTKAKVNDMSKLENSCAWHTCFVLDYFSFVQVASDLRYENWLIHLSHDKSTAWRQ